MMLYAFIKKDGDVKRVGAECSVPEELQAEFKPFSEAGWVSAEAGEWDMQVGTAAKSGMIPDPSLPKSHPAGEESQDQEKPAEVEPAV